VPTLIPVDAITGQPNEEKSVYESLLAVEYIDAIANPVLECHRLLPTDPHLAWKCRYWADKVNKECCSPYYGVLVRTNPKEQRENFDKLVLGLKSFSREIERNGDGTCFLGGGRLSSVDISIMPWAYRYYIFEHYRDSSFAIPLDDPELHAYKSWYDYVFNIDSVKRTLPDKNKYLEHIGKYADASARSKVANAVRRGVAAHEIEDLKDTY
jgi:glutathione S-transferase